VDLLAGTYFDGNLKLPTQSFQPRFCAVSVNKHKNFIPFRETEEGNRAFEIKTLDALEIEMII
jgi:hypothetical protein